MKRPRNVISFIPDPPQDLEDEPEDGPEAGPQVLGVLHREEFELWVCRSASGAISLKWWRWGGDEARFSPLEDGDLTLDPAELGPLAELLISVKNLMKAKGLS